MICIGLLQVNRLGIVAVSEYLDFYFILFYFSLIGCSVVMYCNEIVMLLSR